LINGSPTRTAENPQLMRDDVDEQDGPVAHARSYQFPSLFFSTVFWNLPGRPSPNSHNLSFPHLYGRTAKIFRLFETGIPGSEIEQRNAFGIFLNNQSCSFPDIWCVFYLGHRYAKLSVE
jgi:hypothetical protein